MLSLVNIFFGQCIKIENINEWDNISFHIFCTIMFQYNLFVDWHKECTVTVFYFFTPVVIRRIVSSVTHGWSTYQPTCGKLTKLLYCTLWGYRINSDFIIEFINLFTCCMKIIHFNKCTHTKMEFNWF